MRNVVFVACFIAAVLLLAGTAHAQGVITVGNGCDKATLQAAIDALRGDVDVIHIRQGYESGPVVINGKTVTIIGGFPDCDPNSLPDVSQLAVLNGQAGKAVISIAGRSYVHLYNLIIRGGQHVTFDSLTQHFVGNGGGISFTASGCSSANNAPCLLELHNVGVSSNSAIQGGGIFVDGPAPTSLVIGDNVVIDNNFATHGGGIRIQGATRMYMLQPQSILIENQADITQSDGSGGALQVIGPAHADLGSPGYNGVAAIHSNHARDGAGISVHNGGTVRLFSTDALHPMRIENNDAYDAGGGIYIAPTGGLVCGFGFAINRNNVTHGDGAAIAAVVPDSGTTAVFRFTRWDAFFNDSCGEVPATALFGAAECPPNQLCNLIDGNSGPTAILLNIAIFAADPLEVRGNSGHDVLFAFGGSLFLNNCVIADNGANGSAIGISFAGIGKIDGCTISHNSGGGYALLASDSSQLEIRHSIVWEPGQASIFAYLDSFVVATDTILSDSGHYSDGAASLYTNISLADPKFANPNDHDFRLALGSPAIDYSFDGLTIDAVGNPRGIRADACRHAPGLFDIGAYELQSDNDCIFASGYDQ